MVAILVGDLTLFTGVGGGGGGGVGVGVGFEEIT